MKISYFSKIASLIIISILSTSCDYVYKQKTDANIYLPMGKDSDGCMRYRLKTTEQMSVQVILYKTIDGSYTPNKKMSLCSF